jgi:hypothetical protein
MMSELEEFKALLNKDIGFCDGWQELLDIGYDLDGYETISREEGENRRWARQVTLITKSPTGKLYRWSYDEGLTENQDNEFDDRGIIEVKAVTKTVVVTKYVPV